VTRRKKVGVRVDESLWNEFRENVKSRKGQTRGVLGDELENAIREYIRDDAQPIQRRINSRLSRIERELGVAEADGGSDTFDGTEHTRTPSRIEAAAGSKPSANAATEKKVHYLAECVTDEIAPNSREFKQVPESTLRDIVKDEYGFRSDTARRYVDELKSHFDLVAHPDVDGILVTEAERQSIREQKREQAREDADSELEELTDA